MNRYPIEMAPTITLTGVRDLPFAELYRTSAGQEEMIRRMAGEDRSAWLARVAIGGARRQVRYAIESRTEEDRLSPWTVY